MNIEQIKNRIQLDQIYQYIDNNSSRIKQSYKSQYILEQRIVYLVKNKKKIQFIQPAIQINNVLIIAKGGKLDQIGIEYKDYILIKYDNCSYDMSQHKSIFYIIGE